MSSIHTHSYIYTHTHSHTHTHTQYPPLLTRYTFMFLGKSPFAALLEGIRSAQKTEFERLVTEQEAEVRVSKYFIFTSSSVIRTHLFIYFCIVWCVYKSHLLSCSSLLISVLFSFLSYLFFLFFVFFLLFFFSNFIHFLSSSFHFLFIVTFFSRISIRNMFKIGYHNTTFTPTLPSLHFSI